MKRILTLILVMSFFILALRSVFIRQPQHQNSDEIADTVEFHPQHPHNFLTNVQTVFFGIVEHEHAHDEDFPLSHSHSSKTHSHADLSQLKIDFAHVSNFINITESRNQLFGPFCSEHHHFEFASEIFRPPILG